MAMVSESFLQRIQIKKKNSGGGRIAWVIEIFYKESEMLKKGKIIFLFSVLGRGAGRVNVLFFFYKESKSTHFLWQRVEWKG